jgi:hypothetical protein
LIIAEGTSEANQQRQASGGHTRWTFNFRKCVEQLMHGS